MSATRAEACKCGTAMCSCKSTLAMGFQKGVIAMSWRGRPLAVEARQGAMARPLSVLERHLRHVAIVLSMCKLSVSSTLCDDAVKLNESWAAGGIGMQRRCSCEGV